MTWTAEQVEKMDKHNAWHTMNPVVLDIAHYINSWDSDMISFIDYRPEAPTLDYYFSILVCMSSDTMYIGQPYSKKETLIPFDTIAGYERSKKEIIIHLVDGANIVLTCIL